MAKRGRPSKSKEITIKSRETQVFVGFVFVAVGASLFFNNSLPGTIPVLIQSSFGQTTYILGAIAIVIGLRMVGVKSYVTSQRFLYGLVLLLLAALPLLSAVTDQGDKALSYSEAIQARGGGAIGAVFHQWLQGFLGRPAEIGILWAMVILAVSIVSGMSLEQAGEVLTAIFGFFGKLFGSLFQAATGKIPDSERKPEIVNGQGTVMLKNGKNDVEGRELDIENTLNPKVKDLDIDDVELPELDADKGPGKHVEPRLTVSYGHDLQGGGMKEDAENIQVSDLEQEFRNKYPVKFAGWKMIPSSLLLPPEPEKENPTDLVEKSKKIEQTLSSFKIQARVAKVYVGPSVIQYALNLASGTKISKVNGLARDLGVALEAASAEKIRIESIGGTSFVGIEVPRKNNRIVRASEIIKSSEMSTDKKKIPLALGADIRNDPVVIDLDSMPHVLVAGSTGTGKSATINTILVGLLLKFTPDELRIILVDPKHVEMANYNEIPYLLTPSIDDMDKVVHVLDWAIAEMSLRLQLFKEVAVRKLEEFNEQSSYKLPTIVIVVDEMADLMMRKKQEVENKIVRLAQLARATGIHLILATQRPSVDVITGLIKANIPARISLAVASGTDSRVIIDQYGAETLIGKGDMLVRTPDNAKIRRLQGALVTTNEVNKIISAIREQAHQLDPEADWCIPGIETFVANPSGAVGAGGDVDADIKGDPLFRQAVELVVQQQKGSASTIQRFLKIGFNRAARYIDMMEKLGIVGGPNGAKPREVLITDISDVDAFDE